jgi:hypothetical protein
VRVSYPSLMMPGHSSDRWAKGGSKDGKHGSGSDSERVWDLMWVIKHLY